VCVCVWVHRLQNRPVSFVALYISSTKANAPSVGRGAGVTAEQTRLGVPGCRLCLPRHKRVPVSFTGDYATKCAVHVDQRSETRPSGGEASPPTARESRLGRKYFETNEKPLMKHLYYVR